MRRVLDWLATHFWLILCLFGLAGIPGAHLSGSRTSFGPLPPPIESAAPRLSSAVAFVTDEKGAPIDGADVIALALVGESGQARLAGRGRTGADGRFRFVHLPEAEHWFVARKPGRSRAAVNVVIAGLETREVVLVTGPEHTLEVDVHDDQGIAILNAEIEVRAAGPLPIGARTDITGHARVTGLPPGPWSVTVRATGFEELSQPAVKEGNTALALVLRRLGSLLVHVVDEDGTTPVKDARVQITGTALWPAREGRTGEKGMVKMAGLLAGAYSLRATHGEKVSPIEIAVPLERGQDDEITLKLGPGRRVIVRVTNGAEDDAAGIPGARVVLVEGGLAPFPLEGVTDGSGRVLLGPIAVGPASASAIADGFVDASPVNVAPAPGETRIALVRAGTLFGRIVDSKGRGIDGATLEVVGTDALGMPIDDEPIRASFRRAHFDALLPGLPQLVPAGELGVVPGPVPPIPHAGSIGGPSPALRDAASAIPALPWVSQGDGAFRITPVTPGRVRVIARHPQWVEGQSELVTLPPAGEREVMVVLHAGGALEGRVVDSSNRPVANAHVVVAALRGSLERTTGTGTDGSFAFASLPDAVSVSVFKNDDALHPAVRRSLEIPEGGKKEVTLVLPAERDPMKIAVRDDRSYPVAMAQISVASLDPQSPLRTTAFTDDHGEAVIDGVVGLAVRIDVTSPRSAPKQVVLDAAPRSLDVALEAGLSVTGEVAGERSGPIANASIIAYTDSGVRRATTDAKGEFAFADLAPGDARIRIEADGFARTDVKTKLDKATPAKKLGRIDLPPEAILEGRVVDTKGAGVRAARVAIGSVPTWLAVGTTPNDVATTDSKGAFRLRGLSEGNLAVEAYAPDIGRARTIAQARAGQTTRDVVIALRPDDDTSGGTNAAASVAITLAETGEPGVDRREVFIASVAANSEAERAGLRTGDVVLEVDGAPVRTIADARSRLGGPKGDDVVLKIRRDGRTLAMRVIREAVRR